MGIRKGKGLKAALTSQQSRFKVKKKLLDTEERRRSGHSISSSSQHFAQGSSSAGQAKKALRPFQRPTIPFQPTDQILLIGEGNFSFARALIDDPPGELVSLPPQNITATAYDTEEECYAKHPASRLTVSFLRGCGVEIIFGVDATRLEKHAFLKGKRWDRIVWNFPHAGKGITDQDRNILSNQMLILDFLRSTATLLRIGPKPIVGSTRKKRKKDGDNDNDGDSDDGDDVNHDIDVDKRQSPSTRGTVLITLRNVVPYTLWNVPSLAKNPPAPTGSTPANPYYILLRSFRFHRNVWKGYEHSMTKGERAHGTGSTGEGGEDRTWEFFLRDNFHAH